MAEVNNVEDAIRFLLEQIGEDPNREGLKETPKRVAKAFQEWFGGYNENPLDAIKLFRDGVPTRPQVIKVEAIPFWSHCEHHMAKFFGTVTIEYEPKHYMLGLSKFVRLVRVYSRRLQVQERLTEQLANIIFQQLEPKHVKVTVRARHSCMESRGVMSHGQETETTCVLGGVK